MSEPTRLVWFVVIGDGLTAEQITERLGAAPDYSTVKGEVPGDSKSRRPAQEHAWELRAAGGPDMDLTELVEGIIGRVEPLRPVLVELVHAGLVQCRLQVIQYASADDEIGPGFHLDLDVLDALNELRADVDVDQYVLGARADRLPADLGTLKRVLYLARNIDEPGPLFVSEVVLVFSTSVNVSIRAIAADDTVVVDVADTVELPEGLTDVSGQEPWLRCLGQGVTWMWDLTNDNGYPDAWQVQFSGEEGSRQTGPKLQFLAIASDLRVYELHEHEVAGS